MRVAVAYGPALVPSRIVTAPGAQSAGGKPLKSAQSATAASTIPSPLKSPVAMACGATGSVRSVRVNAGVATVVIGSHAVFDTSPPGTGFRTATAAVFAAAND